MYQLGNGLELRILHRNDVDEVYRLVQRNREHLARFLNWAKTARRVDIAYFVDQAWEFYIKGKEKHFAIRENGKIIGVIGARFLDSWNKTAEIGYWLSQDFQGKGTMTKAVIRLIDMIFFEHHLLRVEVRCAKSNERSQAIPRRLGFQLEGILRKTSYVDGGFDDTLVFGLLKEEWEHLREKVTVPHPLHR